MKQYKGHHACFDCRKTFKRKRVEDINGKYGSDTIARCPQCGGPMADMGLDFESPKSSDVKTWAHIKDLYSVGITFHSCGCSGPGYIPKDTHALRKYLEDYRSAFEHHLKFWRDHQEPTTESELQKDWNMNATFLSQIPDELWRRASSRAKRFPPDNSEAVNYWIGRLRDINERIQLIS
ncbi:MAG TPA: hypothetical protein PKD45_03350 [Flavobacteriales bacterium]|nr:hypothetical protein [Flavobacteriales bacterium]